MTTNQDALEQWARELYDTSLRRHGNHEEAYHVGCGAELDSQQQAVIDAIIAALQPATTKEAAEPGALRALVAAANAVLAENPADDGMWTLEQAVRPFNATKPDECANGCPENQVCDYCQYAALQSTPAAMGKLPELPRSYGEHCVYDSVRVMREPGYTADQMRAYGQACALSARTASVEDVTDDDWHLKGYSYASKQATNCAGCGKHKHTPLRVDFMGGYVCLTCIDKQIHSATTAPVVGDEALHDLVDDLAGDSRAEWDKAQDYQWAEWVRDRHRGKADGLADAARRIKALLDTASTATTAPVVGDADTRRLNWLATNPRGAEIVVNGKSEPCVFWGVSSAPDHTLREAIDAAMQADTARTVSRGESNG